MTPSAPAAPLSVAGLTLRYGQGPVVLREATLTLRPGDLTALVGRNGVGKSSLLRALAGVLLPAQGEVHLGDRPLAELRPTERARRIAFVPQSFVTLPACTVADFVLGGRYAHLGFLRLPAASDHAVVTHALQQADIAPLARRPLAELSGGERQRALIARALAQEARVLLCDEPVAALDLPHQLEVLDLLAGLARAGHVVAFSTHDLNLAAQYATRVVILHEGTILAQGPPHEALRQEVVAKVWGERVRVGADARGTVHVQLVRELHA